MPNGVPLEAFAVPIKPTLPPRPTVSGLLPERERAVAAPTAPKIEPPPKDFITGEAITQELYEKYNALQSFMGEMWGTYGINPQKPDIGSQAGMMANQRYTQLLSDLRGTAQRAKNERKAQIDINLAQSKGAILAPFLTDLPMQEQLDYIFQPAYFKSAVSQFNQDIQKFYSIKDKKQADIKVEEQKESLRKTGEQLKQNFLTGGYSEDINKQYSEYIDTNVSGYISQIEANFVKWGERATQARLREEKEPSATVLTLMRDINKERDLDKYTLDVTRFTTLAGDIIKWEDVLKNLVTPELKKRYGGRQQQASRGIYEQGPITLKIVDPDTKKPLTPKYHILSEDKKHILFIFTGGRVKELSLEESEKSFVKHGKYLPSTPLQTEALNILAGERGETPPTEKGEVPTASMENWVARGWSEEQVIRAEKLGKIKIIK